MNTFNNTSKRKGIWIEAEIAEIEELDITNSVLLQEIVQLSRLKDGCFASNDHFAGLLKINKSSASKRISQLVKLEYITTKNIFKNKNCIGRIITPNLEKIKSAKKVEINFTIEDVLNQPEEEIQFGASGVTIEEKEIELQMLPEEQVVKEELQTSTNEPSSFTMFNIEEENKKKLQLERDEEERISKIQDDYNQNKIMNNININAPKQKEILEKFALSGKTNKEIIDEYFVDINQNWVEDYAELQNLKFIDKYESKLNDEIKIILKKFEYDVIFERFVLPVQN